MLDAIDTLVDYLYNGKEALVNDIVLWLGNRLNTEDNETFVSGMDDIICEFICAGADVENDIRDLVTSVGLTVADVEFAVVYFN